MSDDVIRLSCGILGCVIIFVMVVSRSAFLSCPDGVVMFNRDLCQAFGAAIAPALAGDFLSELYNQGSASPGSQTRTMAKYMMYHAKKLGVTP
jgi:hypothetical protein